MTPYGPPLDEKSLHPSDARTPRFLVPPGQLSSRQRNQSAPNLFRGAWRRRPSASYHEEGPGFTESTKGPLGLSCLYEPSEPRLDFIFVHGLHGGSKKTWSLYPEDVSTYWPEQWLPAESGFKNVRVHSFGYDSDWSKSSQSHLRIRDFAQALLASISNSPTIKRTGQLPIVFIAHSMGGLVAKQAYLLAKSDPLYQDLSTRIHSMYFLATPHRGSNSAVYLKTFLSVSLPTGAKAYAKELLPDSQTVADINEDFRHVCNDIHLWSFFEGIPTAGFIIVDKSSAVIGLPGERTQYLPADHRHVCKFRDMTDPNYMVLRDCFKTTIEQINREHSERQSEQLNQIAEALDTCQRPEKDLLALSDKLHKGTCEWLTKHRDFVTWMDVGDTQDFGPMSPSMSSHKQNRLFWLYGPPGSGKSVAAGHVIKHLTSYNLDCNYFFFKNDSKTSITHLLLSLAFQMAESNFEIRQTILTMLRNGESINTQDSAVIWNSLFLGRLLKVQFTQPLFWIVDGLDECPKKSLSSLIQRFSRIDPRIPLRILLTSRPDSPDAPVEQLLNAEKVGRFELRTGQEASVQDIAAFIRGRPRLSRLLDADSTGSLMADILERSQGIFLWASLIISRLDELYSIEDIKLALREVPSEMNGFYAKILESITNSSNADKAKAILSWVACAPGPLTVEELKEAVRLDINQTLLSSVSGDVFSEICGSLVTVNQDSCVHFMHQTVKEFLISAASNFYVNYREVHERMATICLELMDGRDGLKRTSKRTKPTVGRPTTSSLMDYACSNFSYHLLHSHSVSDITFTRVVDFFESKTLIWIEHVAKRGRLSLFMRTIKNIKPYLARQLETSPPFSQNYQDLLAWVDDLTHIVSIFGQTLIDSPEAIYALIPPLCPSSSFIHRKFASSCPQKVITSSNRDWDERLSCINFQSSAKCIASSDHHFAAGLTNGTIKIFNNTTFEEVAVLKHGAPVRHLAFGNVTNTLVSCSPKAISVWSPQQELLWRKAISGIASSVCFNVDDTRLFVTLKNDVKRAMLTFATADGAELEPLTIPEDSSSSSSGSDSEADGNNRNVSRFCPEIVCVSPVLGLAAVTWRSSHLTIFSMDENGSLEKFCKVEKEGSEEAARAPQILAVVFNPAAEADLMAVAYQDGDIVTVQIDEWNPEQTNVYSLHARTLASSPDGRTLAAGDTEGGISLLTFDTLRLLQRLDPLDEIVTGMIFSSNSLRALDVRGKSCNAWEPTVLVRKSSMDDNSSDPEEYLVATPESPSQAVRPFDDSRVVTVITQTHDEKFFFCGREDGSVTIHHLKTGQVVLELKLHAAEIRHLDFDHKKARLLSVDTSRRCVFTQLIPTPSKSAPLAQGENILDHRAQAAITQALVSPNGTAILISTLAGQEIWDESRGQFCNHSVVDGRWMIHPADDSRILLARGQQIELNQWTGLQEKAEPHYISLSLSSDIRKTTIPNEWFSQTGIDYLFQALPLHNGQVTAFLMLQALRLQPSVGEASVSASVRNMVAGVKSVIAISRSSVIFLDRGGWVCSLSIKNISEAKSYTRHFFIPPFWRVRGEFMVKVVAKNTLAIAHKDDVVVVHGFMDFNYKMDFLAFPDEDDTPLVLRRRVTNL